MSSQMLGKYAVVRQLGVGGMAEVLLCRRHGLGGFDKEVVIKRIRDDIRHDEGYVAMFLDEARVAANLNHPNIVQIFEIDEVDGLPYIAMEYVHGPTLAHILRLQRHAMPARAGDLAHVIGGIAAGLHCAHNARDADGAPLGIVHRDISPHNIIVSLDGIPKLFDFGVAKARGNRALTNVGLIKGKLGYMAPEQLMGRPVDHRADIFALGVCLYEATVGLRPFAGASEGELFATRLAGTFARPSEIAADYPRELERIVLATMDPDPASRPSGAELHQALAGFATGPHASSNQQVADWLAQLGCDDASDRPGDAYVEAYVVGPTPAPTPVPARGGGSSRMWSMAMPIDRPRARRPVAVAGAVAAVLASAAVAYAVITRGPAADLVRPMPAAASAAPTPAPSEAAQVRIYIDEARRLAGLHRWDAAADMLARTPQHRIEDAALDVARASLTDEIELGRLRERARRALDGNDPVAALAALDALLDRAPDDPEGQRLLARVQAVHAATTAPTGVGTLTVATRAGAAVYLDGQLVDHSAIRRRAISAGPHELTVRLAGFEPVHRMLAIRADRDTALSIALREASDADRAAPPTPPTTAPAVAIAPPAPIAPPDAAEAPIAIADEPVAPPQLPPDAALARPDAGAPVAAGIAAPRLPSSYTARSMKELTKVMSVIEGEAIERGATSAALRGVSGGIVEEAFANFAPGELIEVHPSAIYYAIVRAARAGHAPGAIAAELRAAYARGQL